MQVRQGTVQKPCLVSKQKEPPRAPGLTGPGLQDPLLTPEQWPSEQEVGGAGYISRSQLKSSPHQGHPAAQVVVSESAHLEVLCSQF